MKRKLLSITAFSVIGLGALGVAGGVVSAQTGNVRNTGPDSYNRITSRVNNERKVRNYNTVMASNTNDQKANTGAVSSTRNTTGGNAASGTASNAASYAVAGTVTNTPSSTAAMATPASAATGANAGSIDTTGPDSTNVIKSTVNHKTSVTNDNVVCVTSDNVQTSQSGDVTVSRNTTGGSAMSGHASNTSNTSVTLSVSNQQ